MLRHRLFAHPQMVEGLVREFVPRGLVAGLDFSGLQRVNPKFHSGRWKAATTTRELIALSPDSALWPWQPQVRYHLLDMGAFPKDELARRSSLVALLFRLEQRQLEESDKLLGEVVGWFREHEGYERLRGLFAELIRESFAAHGVTVSGDALEIKTMKSNIPRNIDLWVGHLLAKGKAAALAEGRAKGEAKGLVKGKAEGLAEGRAKGEAEGLVKGKAEALVCLLAERFGAVAPSLRERIRRAKLPTLERWFKRAIVAPDLPSVFNPRVQIK